MISCPERVLAAFNAVPDGVLAAVGVGRESRWLLLPRLPRGAARAGLQREVLVLVRAAGVAVSVTARGLAHRLALLQAGARRRHLAALPAARRLPARDQANRAVAGRLTLVSA